MMNIDTPTRRLGAVLAATLLVGACKSPDSVVQLVHDASALSAARDDNTARLVPAMTDGEIMGVLSAADSREIELGNFAQAQAADGRVRAYALSTVAMHARMSERMGALRQRISVSPVESARSRSIAGDTNDALQRFSLMHGTDFDRGYLDAQAAQHARLLETIDGALIPAARDDGLRTALLSDFRPMVVSHLQQARDLRAAFNWPSSPPPSSGIPAAPEGR